MMETLAVEAREIHVTVRMSITDVRGILRCMDSCVLELDMSDPDNVKSEQIFKDFYRFLDNLNQGVGNGRVEQARI